MRTETIIDVAHEPPGGEPKAFCTFPLFVKHNPKRFYPCWKPAVIVDALFPVYWDGNRCAHHSDWTEPLTFEI